MSGIGELCREGTEKGARKSTASPLANDATLPEVEKDAEL
jgi:hypothetical protein